MHKIIKEVFFFLKYNCLVHNLRLATAPFVTYDKEKIECVLLLADTILLMMFIA